MTFENSHPTAGNITLKCLVIDDELPAVKKLEKFITNTPGLEFTGFETDPIKAQHLLAALPSLPDVVFLDIEMKGPTGLRIARQIMGKTLIVFTTAHTDFAVEAYRLNAADYLLKPISYTHFLEAIKKCRLYKQSAASQPKADPRVEFLKDSLSGQTFKVKPEDILYLQSIGNYCKIHMANRSTIMVHIALKQLLSHLKNETLLRIHKSYAVNLKHIISYEGNGSVELENEIKLEVGRTFKKALRDKIKKAHGS